MKKTEPLGSRGAQSDASWEMGRNWRGRAGRPPAGQLPVRGLGSHRLDRAIGTVSLSLVRWPAISQVPKSRFGITCEG